MLGFLESSSSPYLAMTWSRTIRSTKLTTGEKVEIYFFVGLGTVLLVLGYLQADQDLQQWGIILIMLAFVFFVSYRELIRSRLLLPGQALEAYELVVRLVANAERFLYVIDTYPDEATTRAIACAPEGIPVRLLTEKYREPPKAAQFEAVALKAMQMRSNLEIRYAPNGILHDRFLLTEAGGWILGQSIKDIGNKLGAISTLSDEDTKKTIQFFEDTWSRSTPIH